MKLLSSLFIAVSLFLTITGCAQKSPNRVEIFRKTDKKDLSKLSQATFAAGCFWHEEALFESIKGVNEAISGYAGGNTSKPTYESIESGTTGHAETVNIYYDSTIINYATLLKAYFAAQDPTQVNGQGPDRGTQYRSIAFYRNNSEKLMIEDYIKKLNTSGKYNNPIAVQVAPLVKFWQAEEYHQDYIRQNPGGGYVQNVSIPEIQHFQKQYPELIKPDHKF
ncbi:MAG: peptide-methionine (S)-S-oxide reductase MsrA [Ginsengibacter sp.]